MKPLVVADIGGTHARVARIERGSEIAHVEVVRTRDVDTTESLIESFIARHGKDALGICVAIAGPVADGVGRLTNGTLEIDAARLAQHAREVLILNDFAAAAMGIPRVQSQALVALSEVEPRPGTKALIGPGTGLGMGMLFATPDGYRAMPSEGGHGDLASTSPLEHEIYQLLGAETQFVSWETVLSGPGLVNLYRAVCAVWGCAPSVDTPEAVTAAAREAADPVCHQTVELFCNLLGGAAGNLAITVCAEGGVYLCGGMIPHLLDALAASQFRRRFEARGPMTDYLRPIATVAVVSPYLGLIGAAGAHRAQFGE